MNVFPRDIIPDMKKSVGNVGAFFIGALLFIWNLPFVLLGTGGAFVYWLFFDLPNRKKQKQDFKNEVIDWRQRKKKYAYLSYDRNHSFSEWVEEYLIPKYERQLIVSKFTTQKYVLSEEFRSRMWESEHGGDELYWNVDEEDNDIATLFVFNPYGTVKRRTPTMPGEV